MNGVQQEVDTRTALRIHVLQESITQAASSTCPGRVLAISPQMPGRDLCKPLGASIEGFVNGETAPFSVTGSQTEVGSSKNTYTIDWSASTATAKEKNYEVSESLGTLTVTSARTTATTTTTTPTQRTTTTPSSSGTTTTTRTTTTATPKTADSSMAVMPFLVSASAALIAGLRRRKRK